MNWSLNNDVEVLKVINSLLDNSSNISGYGYNSLLVCSNRSVFINNVLLSIVFSNFDSFLRSSQQKDDFLPTPTVFIMPDTLSDDIINEITRFFTKETPQNNSSQNVILENNYDIQGKVKDELNNDEEFTSTELVETGSSDKLETSTHKVKNEYDIGNFEDYETEISASTVLAEEHLFSKEPNGQSVKFFDDEFKKSFTCSICGDLFDDEEKYKIHFQRYFVDSNGFTCPQVDCDVRFKTTRGLKYHYRNHEEIYEIHCTECEAISKSGVEQVKHTLDHNRTVKIVCKICRKFCLNRMKYWSHMWHTHASKEKMEKLTSSQCGRGFTKRDSLKSHVLAHSNTIPYT